MLIDTHCHLHDAEWFTPQQQSEFLQKAHDQGVDKIICIGTDPKDSANAQQFASQHKNVYWTYGIHPEFADSDKAELGREGDYYSFAETIRSATSEEEAASARNESRRSLSERRASSSFRSDARESERSEDGTEERRVSEKDNNYISRPVAIGEIGLDYHYAGYNRTAQIKLFEQMLQLATDLQLPVSLHIRERQAFADAWAVLDNFPQIKGVVHSFTGSKAELHRALERGFYIGVNGLATYSTLPLPPLERMLLETDAPFLTPAPFRGTINEPGYVKIIATYLAEQLGAAEVEVMEQTTKNARQLFKI